MKLVPLMLVAATMQLGVTLTGPPMGLDLYMPVPEANVMTVTKVERGRRLFSDRRLSRDHSVSCATCHDAERAFTDGRVVSVGVFGRVGHRNAPALINRGYGRLFFWDGRAQTLEQQVLQPIENPLEMDLPIAEAVERTGLSASGIAEALASYLRSIQSADAPFDRYLDGDLMSLTTDERLGLAIFRGKGNCVSCHIGPNFSDERLHNTGVAWDGQTLTDMGGGRGDFKTPSLREVARTPPYMHDGSVASLDEVIEFYDRGGRPNPNLDSALKPLGLSAVEKRGLASFLRALSGTIVTVVRRN